MLKVATNKKGNMHEHTPRTSNNAFPHRLDGSGYIRSRHAGGTFDKIRSTGTITLGYREASIPFSYLGGDQKPEGFSLELCSWIADRIKTELRLDRPQITYIAVNAANRIPLI